MSEKIKKGYEGFNVPDDFNIPSSGIEDVDRAIVNLFRETLAFEVKTKEQTKRVPVVFAAGERFALTRRQKPIRDKNNTIILPIIAIRRTSIGHKSEQEVFGTAISFRQQGDYVIKKRLSWEDRDYQNLINKQRLKNQNNTATRGHLIEFNTSPGQGTQPGTIASRRNGGNLSFGSGKMTFPLDDKNIGNNIFEVITIPYPQFVGLTYNVTFWTQYEQQMNEMIESMMMKFTGIGHEFLMISDKGYEYMAFVQGPFSMQDNFEDYTNTERIIKTSFDIKVPGYILAPENPGLPNPYRVFQSAPFVEFGMYDAETQIAEPPPTNSAEEKINKFILTDTNALDSKGDKQQNRSDDKVKAVVDTDAGLVYDKIVYRNLRAGETIVNARQVKKIEDESI